MMDLIGVVKMASEKYLREIVYPIPPGRSRTFRENGFL